MTLLMLPYQVKVTANGNFYYESGERTAEYWIMTPGMYHYTVVNGSINDTKSGEFAPGSELTAKADKPEDGKVFTGWKVNGKVVSRNETYTFKTSEENLELEAIYSDERILDSVKLTEEAPTPIVSSGKTRVRAAFSAEAADGYTISEYGMIYSNDGTVTDTSELTIDNVDGTRIKQGTGAYAARILDNGSGVVAVGYVKVEDSNGSTVTLYTDDIGGKYAELALAASVTLKTEEPTAVVSGGKNRVRAAFSAEVPEDVKIEEYGMIYSNNGTVTDVAELTIANVDGTNIKQGTGAYAARILDSGSGVIAVGYVTVSDDKGNTVTVYTENIGGSFEALK